MRQNIQLTLSPEEAHQWNIVTERVAENLNIAVNRISHIRLLKQSIDARSRQVKFVLLVEAYWDEPALAIEKAVFNFSDISNRPSVIVIGAGPAGFFSALRLIELGFRPILIERGKNARQRKIDIASINRNKSIDPDSNYCFGEGGAGTFSDGKLYTRSKKKGDVQRILELFHYHGADENILYEAHPHIGSNKLPLVVEQMTKTILDCGGEIHFETRMDELIIDNSRIKGCKTTDGRIFEADALILATGHSAQDVYELLDKQSVRLEQKGFAMGVRVEHPQQLIDKIQYHQVSRGDYLPAASYSLVEQIDGRGVYSFCMCPGGHIVPAGNGKEEIVVNGMSVSKRNSRYANSGIVVEIRPEDVPEEFHQHGTLAGLRFQQYIENLAYRNNGGKGFTAPAQRLYDFVDGRLSADLPNCSYIPGLISSPLHFWLPEIITKRLREAFRKFDRKMNGYLTNDAVVVAVESRSSSPVRIPRDAETMQHPDIKGLFPCGEGSGYSGGITSSAIDGENAALKVAEYLSNI